MISEKRSPDKFKMKLKVTARIWNQASESSVGIEEIKHIKPK